MKKNKKIKVLASLFFNRCYPFKLNDITANWIARLQLYAMGKDR
jgi:hypothetical protein